MSLNLHCNFYLHIHNTDKEYMADLRYIATKNMSVRTHYDSDMGFGVGLSINY